MYGRIVGGELKMSLPNVGQLNDGRWVSNYDLLPFETLRLDGWKPVTEIKPIHDQATQHLEIGQFTDNGESISLTYIVVPNDDPLAELEGLL